MEGILNIIYCLPSEPSLTRTDQEGGGESESYPSSLDMLLS